MGLLYTIGSQVAVVGGKPLVKPVTSFDPNTLADTFLVHNHAAADQVTLSGSDVRAWVNRGTLDMSWRYSGVAPTWLTDADGTGMPAVSVAGNATMLARNAADSANKSLADFMTASTFFLCFVAVVDTPAGASSYLLYDNAMYFWLRNTLSGNIDLQAWDSGYRTSTLTRQAGSLALYAYKHEGGLLYKSLNGAAWDAGTSLNNIPVLTGLLAMGGGGSHAADHRVFRHCFHNAIPVGISEWLAELAAYYGVA